MFNRNSDKRAGIHCMDVTPSTKGYRNLEI